MMTNDQPIKPSIPLPIRVAHPPRPELERLDDDYFALLTRCGYEGLYLQDSPFDALSGNHGPFRKMFHLISLYDLSNSPERERYREYIHEVCRRAARHGLKTHLCCWEPRLPYAAWGDTPPTWRGRGGFAYAGRIKTISFCWSVPAHSPPAEWERATFEIFARHYRSMRNYLRLGQVKFERSLRRVEPAAFGQRVREIAADESENLRGLESWLTRYPNQISNPCHSVRGWMEQLWPDEEFEPDLLAPKRRSLEALLQT